MHGCNCSIHNTNATAFTTLTQSELDTARKSHREALEEVSSAERHAVLAEVRTWVWACENVSLQQQSGMVPVLLCAADLAGNLLPSNVLIHLPCYCACTLKARCGELQRASAAAAADAQAAANAHAAALQRSEAASTSQLEAVRAELSRMQTAAAAQLDAQQREADKRLASAEERCGPLP